MPPAKVVYIVDSPECIYDVCDELARIIISNRSSEYRIGIVARGVQEARFIHSMSKLTVLFATQLREQAFETFASLGGSFPLEREDDPTFIKSCLSEVKSLILEQCDACIVRRRNGLAVSTNNTILLNGMKSSEIPKRKVKPVKTFDGYFTVGDVNNPLLKLPICLYPATKRATPVEMVSYVGNDRVVRSSELKTESGAPVNLERVQKGYTYLNQLIPVTEDIQELMDGEFEGAEEWHQSFELLATVPEVPPWIPFEKTDYIVGKTPRAVQFLKSLAASLLDTQMHALVRMCHEPRTRTMKDGTRKKRKKGKLSLVLLQPSAEGYIFVSPLPFKDDFKSYYRFADIPSEPQEELKVLDDQMDELVDGMTVDCEPELIRNHSIERVASYLKTKIATGRSEVPPKPEIGGSVSSDHLVKLSESLSAGFGISELNTANRDNEQSVTDGIEFEFI